MQHLFSDPCSILTQIVKTIFIGHYPKKYIP